MKDALILEHKTYISARRAAELTGYTSDYVGQLCRAGKIESKIVARSWFVLEESLLKHKLINDQVKTNKKTAKKRRALQAQQERREIREENFRKIEETSSQPLLLEEKLEEKKEKIVEAVAQDIQEIKAPEKTKFESFKYEAVQSPLIPLLKKKILEDEAKKNNREIKVNFVPKNFSVRKINVSVASPFSTPINQTRKTAVYSFADDFAAVMILLIVVIGGGFLMKPTLLPLSQSTNPNEASLVAVSAQVFEVIAKGWSGISNKVISYLGTGNVTNIDNIATNYVTNSPQNVSTPDSNDDLGFNGLAVVPSTNSPQKDELIKQRIKNSFSDEVTVRPDSTGTSGIITPVFKKASADDFVYVLVPIQETTH